MRRDAAGSRTSFCHHPVEYAQAFVVARFLDHLPFPGADPVSDPDRLRRGVESFQLPLVVDEDLPKAARVESADGPRSPIPDRREIPPIAKVAPQLRLAALRLPPSIVELAVAEPLLAAELRPLGVLRGSECEEFLQAGLEFRLRSRLVDFCLGLFLLFLLFPFRLLFFLLLGRLWFFLGLLRRSFLRRGCPVLFLFCDRLRRLFLDVPAKTFAKVVDFAFLAQPVSFGPADQLGLLRGADLGRGR